MCLSPSLSLSASEYIYIYIYIYICIYVGSIALPVPRFVRLPQLSSPKIRQHALTCPSQCSLGFPNLPVPTVFRIPQRFGSETFLLARCLGTFSARTGDILSKDAHTSPSICVYHTCLRTEFYWCCWEICDNSMGPESRTQCWLTRIIVYHCSMANYGRFF